ncbi:MAG: response regulator [Candidatus Binatia bacterium]
MRFRRHMWLASAFVLLSVAALVIVGILVLVFQRATVDITFGVLILAFCVVVLVGAVWLAFPLKRAADLSQLQLDFLSKVSHEFKTPLTSIRLFTQTLLEPRPLTDEQRRQCLEMLDHETGRLSLMIDRLLDLGRMEAGSMVYHRQPERVGAVVDAALRAFEPIRLQAHVTLATDVPRDLPPILADRTMLSQALLNLLQNAVKPAATTATSPCAAAPTRATSSCRSPTTAPASPRRRAPPHLRALLPHRRPPRPQAGGQRARPRHRPPRRPGARRQRPGPQSPRGRRRVLHPRAHRLLMASERVLLIEDDPSIVAGLQLNLSLEGYEVLTAGDGDSGYQMAVDGRPDLVLLDVMLPGMNGFEVLRRLRELDAEMPVIVLHRPRRGRRQGARPQLGADDYIAKPFNLPELRAFASTPPCAASGCASPASRCASSATSRSTSTATAPSAPASRCR